MPKVGMILYGFNGNLLWLNFSMVVWIKTLNKRPVKKHVTSQRAISLHADLGFMATYYWGAAKTYAAHTPQCTAQKPQAFADSVCMTDTKEYLKSFLHYSDKIELACL